MSKENRHSEIFEQTINKRKRKNRSAKKVSKLSKMGRSGDLVKLKKRVGAKKRRVKLKLNKNTDLNPVERKSRDKLRDLRRKEHGFKPIDAPKRIKKSKVA